MKARTISFAIAVSLCSTVPAVAEQGVLNLLRQTQQMADLGIRMPYTGYERQDGGALIGYGADRVADIRGETLTGPLYAQIPDLGVRMPYTGYERQDGGALIGYGVDRVADIRGETLTGPLYAQIPDLGIRMPYTGYENLFDAQPINPSFDGSN